MNLILLQSDDYIAADRVVLRDSRFEQISRVHQSVVDDTVRVGNINGLMGIGRILSIDSQQVDLAVTLDTEPPPKLPLTLLLALPRPKMLRRILRTVAELGVENLMLINSYRVEKSYWSSPALEAQNIREYFLNGLQQSRDTRLPGIEMERRFKPFVEDRLPAMMNGRQGIVAHPHTGPGLVQTNQPTVLAIGPEGGFIDYEIEKLQQAGFATLDLGPRIYRVENAINYTIGKLFGQDFIL